MPNHSEKRRHFDSRSRSPQDTETETDDNENRLQESPSTTSQDDPETCTHVDQAESGTGNGDSNGTSVTTPNAMTFPFIFTPSMLNSILGSTPNATSASSTADHDDLNLTGAGSTPTASVFDTNAVSTGQMQQQLLQLQQQQLQSLSTSDLASMATMAQQMALGMMMFPMGSVMPWMMQSNTNNNREQDSESQEQNEHAEVDQHEVKNSDGVGSQTMSALAQAMALAAQSNAFKTEPGSNGDGMSLPSISSTADAFSSSASLLSNSFMSSPMEENQRRKRGRPSKQESGNHSRSIKTEDGIGKSPHLNLGLPYLSSLTHSLGYQNSGTGGDAGMQEEASSISNEIMAAFTAAGNAILPSTGSATNTKNGSKKKARGTGRPRGRPRTRPRPGDIVPRSKPPAIAPANYSLMYNYPLTTNSPMSGHKGQEGMSIHNGNGSTSTDNSQQHLGGVLNNAEAHNQHHHI